MEHAGEQRGASVLMDDILDLIDNASPNQRAGAIAAVYNLAADLPHPLGFPDGSTEDVGGLLMRTIRAALTTGQQSTWPSEQSSEVPF